MNLNNELNKDIKLTILIAEDNDTLRRSLYDLFHTYYTGSHILEAKDGEEAVSLALAIKPDIIFMDIKMPRMNGLDATRRIKEVLPDVRVVIITVHENPEYKIDAAAAGVSAYVIKHNIIKALRNVMVSLLSHPEERDRLKLYSNMYAGGFLL